MNAANEVAVAAFLARSVTFLDIDAIVSRVVEEHSTEKVESFDQLEQVDTRARSRAEELVSLL
jgi:1-deoxy-D-xylulose-5-phosphate reductoisomerase